MRVIYRCFILYLQIASPLHMHKCTLTCDNPSSLSPHRKNPIHFQEYSHDFSSSTPDGADSGDGSDDDKPMCPYGTACYRCIHVHYDNKQTICMICIACNTCIMHLIYEVYQFFFVYHIMLQCTKSMILTFD